MTVVISRRTVKGTANLGQGNSLDLDWNTLWELLDGNTGASGLVSEVLLVDAVHLGEVTHGSEEDVDLQTLVSKSCSYARRRLGLAVLGGFITDLDDLGDGAAGILEDVLHALAAGLGLLGNGAIDQVASGISGKLARDEDLAVGVDGLGVWADS